jgi:hypothetical protein
MKTLKEYLKEMEGGATPGNTMGMGNPMAPGMDGTPGTEPLVTNRTAKTKKEKKNASKSTIK